MTQITKATIDLNYYALRQVFSITYNNNGGTDTYKVYSYSRNSDTIFLSDAYKQNDSFLGWYDNQTFSGNSIKTILPGSSGNLVLWAKYKSNTSVTTQINNHKLSIFPNPATNQIVVEGKKVYIYFTLYSLKQQLR